jgi:hypothetical protein
MLCSAARQKFGGTRRFYRTHGKDRELVRLDHFTALPRETERRFLFEVLYDEHFSSGLKINVYSKITSEQSWTNKLRRLSSIRNYFAHRGREITEVGRDRGPFVPIRKAPRNPSISKLYIRSLRSLLVPWIASFSKIFDASVDRCPTKTTGLSVRRQLRSKGWLCCASEGLGATSRRFLGSGISLAGFAGLSITLPY